MLYSLFLTTMITSLTCRCGSLIGSCDTHRWTPQNFTSSSLISHFSNVLEVGGANFGQHPHLSSGFISHLFRILYVTSYCLSSVIHVHDLNPDHADGWEILYHVYLESVKEKKNFFYGDISIISYKFGKFLTHKLSLTKHCSIIHQLK